MAPHSYHKTHFLIDFGWERGCFLGNKMKPIAQINWQSASQIYREGEIKDNDNRVLQRDYIFTRGKPVICCMFFACE
jgi:hypothetical protein